MKARSNDQERIMQQAKQALNGIGIENGASKALITDNLNAGLFNIRKASRCISDAHARDVPNKLFDSFWFENEVCILFADTGAGKSILAVQIADSITKGRSIDHEFDFEGTPQPVLYFDFELTDMQFSLRYSDDEYTYQFDDNFLRAEIDPDCDLPDGIGFESYVVYSIEQIVKRKEAKVLIIDNLTYLGTDNEKSKNALSLMKDLKKIKNKYDLSLLILAHTPKRDFTKTISRNDVEGSKALINFCDSAFAIGESYRHKKLRYFKQIKARNCPIEYDEEHIPVFEIEKDKGFLKFCFLKYDQERDQLKLRTEEDKEIERDLIWELRGKGMSIREIARETGIPKSTVSRWLNENDVRTESLQNP